MKPTNNKPKEEQAFNPNAAALPDSGIFGLPCDPKKDKVIILPVPFEATTSYGGGTANGPQAIFHASKQVDLFDPITGNPYEAGISMLLESREIIALNKKARALAQPIIQAGGVAPGNKRHERDAAEVNEICNRVHRKIYEHVKIQLERDKIPIVLGGDHSVAQGAIEAYAEKFPKLGVLQIDAHADLRDGFEGFEYSHASVMHNVLYRRLLPGSIERLVQVGLRDIGPEEHECIQTERTMKIKAFFAHEVKRGACSPSFVSNIFWKIAQALPDEVYVSFDIDGLDQSMCPHTGTPVPGGLTWDEMEQILQALVENGKRIVGCDLVEVTPGPTHGDEWDANVGARVLYKLIGYMLLSQKNK
ncbi:MAG: agmatinase family protein [Candidatus Liptonbacteria bacterium]|nr:agmatinase family protein [Candidatus Liptonbacteria bacterium]